MLRDALIQAGMNAGLATFLDILGGVLLAASFGMVWVLLGIWIERKIAARIQNRVGPNRVGPYGLIQSVADALKLLVKEVIVPRHADRPVYFLAPVLMVVSVILVAAVIPFSSVVIGTDLNIGLLYVLAVGSLGTLAIVMAGWGSNNKYALLGAFRAVAQLISYEVPMVLALLVPVLLSGSMSTQTIVQEQHIMYLFAVPLTVLIFLTSGQAETGRGPFDLLEAESELVSGFHIEYSGMKFGMFYVAEFLHAFNIGVLTAILFMGGWRGPFAEDVPLLGFVYLMIKSLVAYVVLIWVRMTLPRLRIDQLLDFNWKFLVPLSLVNLLVVAFVWKVVPDTYHISDLGDAIVPTLVLLVVNIAMIAVVGAILRELGRRERQRIEARMTAAKPAAAGD